MSPTPRPSAPTAAGNTALPRCVLIANRGEIVTRIARTARRLGIRTAGVYSDADADAAWLDALDLAVAIGGTTPATSYLRAEAVIDAARRAGADALHPGYGFLSEDAGFAAAVEAAGLRWIGPPPAAIAAMGAKLEAKRLAAAAGVAMLASAELAGDDPDAWRHAAHTVGYPLLVKASAGGGGKGMRLVRAEDELADAIVAGRREAASAFGDPTVFAERALDAPRHVEVQILADTAGRTIAIGERECSIQRRHQKVVEEAPSPGIDDRLRAALAADAVRLAEQIGYVGAGTVEFLVDATQPTPTHAFLEVNTRLQVEHPVTEAVWGLDLVEWQFRIAAGETLPADLCATGPSGHAIEVRLYAEDPAAGWLPSAGHLAAFAPDPDGPALRWECGVAAGSDVSPFYDPMLAKVIAHAPTRALAASQLAAGLERMTLAGIRTNRDALVAALRDPDFLAGATTTDFLDTRPWLSATAPEADAVARAAALAALDTLKRAAATSPWPFAPPGWRNLRAAPTSVRLTHAGADLHVGIVIARDGTGFDATVGTTHLRGRILAHDPDANTLSAEVDGIRRTVRILHAASGPPGSDGIIAVAGPDGGIEFAVPTRFTDHLLTAAGGGPTAPVPGTVTVVAVTAGEHVNTGDVLVVMEAMKMEHRIVAPHDGVVATVHVSPGDTVDAHALLVSITAHDDTATDADNTPTPQAPETPT